MRNNSKEVEKFNYDLDSTIKTMKNLGEINTFSKISIALSKAIQFADLANRRKYGIPNLTPQYPVAVTEPTSNYSYQSSYQSYTPISTGPVNSTNLMQTDDNNTVKNETISSMEHNSENLVAKRVTPKKIKSDAPVVRKNQAFAFKSFGDG